MHACRARVSYQLQIIADPEPSINLLYDCENRMRSMQIAVSGWTWLILTFSFYKFGLLAQYMHCCKSFYANGRLIKICDTTRKLTKVLILESQH